LTPTLLLVIQVDGTQGAKGKNLLRQKSRFGLFVHFREINPWKKLMLENATSSSTSDMT